MKHNQIILCGVLKKAPKIITDEQGKRYTQFRVISINGYRTGGRRVESKAYDMPVIHSYNEKVVDTAAKAEAGDLVIIKGAITTFKCEKSPVCPACGEKNSYRTTMTYISPSGMTIARRGAAINDKGEFSNSLAESALLEYKEISNVLTLIGVVAADPRPYKTDVLGQAKMTSYRLAVKRKFRIIGELDNNTADFPIVKSYGSISMKDGLHLQKGTYIFIDGWFRARQIEKTCTCKKCGKEFEYTSFSSDIVPYACEYIKNYKDDADVTTRDVALYNARREEIPHENDADDIIESMLTDEDKKEAEKLLDEIEAEDKKFDEEDKKKPDAGTSIETLEQLRAQMNNKNE